MNSKKNVMQPDFKEQELQELGAYLGRQDFSRQSDPAAVLRKARSRSIQKTQEAYRMKNKQRIRRPVMIAASLLVAAVVSVSFVRPSFAQEMVERILNSVNLGHIEVAQTDSSVPPVFPEAWKGRIFDQEGNPVTSFDHMPKAIFNEAGEAIVNLDGDKLVTLSEQEQRDKEAAAQIFTVNEPAKLNQYAAFKVKLPEYLPEGFAFDHGQFYKDGKDINGQIVELFFGSKDKDKRIWMQLRQANEENAYAMSTDDKVERVKLKGTDAVLVGDRSLDWEVNGVMYSLSTRGLDRAEVLKIAESINW
ncbi:DUF4367 domain-containing protein [Paenibacillus piscarius]|uniref:DUF4367 domain-containing protein n=1 Tax=Paenibacillus piscarius TaxID=1089681 RepID=UPI001EE7AB70|nr:DUF4367 domain-containing protein [Paenibacillus piscarius]